MASHRSPDGRRAHTVTDSSAARHRAAARPAPTGPSLRNTVLATTAAFGAVATGTFTALVPHSEETIATTASAEEAPATAMFAAAYVTHPAAEVEPESAPSAPAVAPATALVPIAAPVENTDAAVDSQHLARLDKAASIADKLAAQHARAAERARARQLASRGGLDGWIAQALQISGLPQSYAPGVKKIIMAESGGNPRAINNWDSNARRGTPSQGLMQTIPSTFNHYVHPDVAHRPITDPVANITAGVRYMVDTYGASTLAAGGRSNSSGGYVGY